MMPFEDVLKPSHGSLNVPMFHITQPLGIWSINVYNGYYKVMSNIPKMGHLPTPVEDVLKPSTSKNAMNGELDNFSMTHIWIQ